MTGNGDEINSEKFGNWWEGDLNGLHQYKDFSIPISLIMKTGAGPAVFEQIANGHRLALETWIGIEPTHDVLEIGCGIGRDAMWLSQLLTQGSYTGIDIIPESIKWCRENISNKFPRMSFFHFDVEDSLHNPLGQSSVECFRFPRPDRSIDRIFAFSVFTHMYADQIGHYLAECARVLRPGGRAFLTIFLYDEEILKAAAIHANTPFDLKFDTQLEPGCRINNPAEPLGAIAYTWDRIEPLIANAGLTLIRAPLNGSWSGFFENPHDGQDVLLLERQT
jgi:SAM-dependent methyltransferase